MGSDIEGGERFVLEPQWERPEFGEDYDGLCVVDTLTDAVVGADGGEPEDQTLGRDWRWVVAALNSVNAERDAAIAERDDLLAIIHRDGGHYVGEHGITKAVADAHATWAAVVAERDRLRAELEALRDAMVNEWRRGDVDASSAALRLRFDAILSGEGER